MGKWFLIVLLPYSACASEKSTSLYDRQVLGTYSAEAPCIGQRDYLREQGFPWQVMCTHGLEVE